jgi:hypothetical protein
MSAAILLQRLQRHRGRQAGHGALAREPAGNYHQLQTFVASQKPSGIAIRQGPSRFA